MAQMKLTNPASLGNYFQPVLSKQLIDRISETLRLNTLAQQVDLPKNLGSKTVKFFQFNGTADANEVQTLTEGTPISTYRELGLNSVEVSLVQYGEALNVSDLLSNLSLFNVLQEGVKLLGEDAALKADNLSRAELISGTDVAGNSTKKRYGQGLANFAAVNSAAASAAFIDAEDLLDAATELKANKSNPLNGKFTALVPPQVARDLFRDTDFLNSVYRNPTSGVGSLYAGELGTFYGLRIIEHTNPWIEGTSEGTYSAAGSIYSTIVLGESAFGVVKLSGDSPFSPKVTVLTQADKSDILNQTVKAGYKCYYAAKLMNAKRAVVVKSKSRFTAAS